MVSTPVGARLVAGRSFPQLWQQGCDGHLPGAFTFGWPAVYTLVALSGALVAELVPVLVEVQVAARAQEHASPAHFADELAKAADRLRELLTQATSAQQKLRDVGDQVVHGSPSTPPSHCWAACGSWT
ncbi:MAG TPA: hypothetical protein VFX16_07965 [Pseudonocardiaceae bacterium]|nr:hypothetical protein [Pseudonocardiaceae bacterium]